MKKLLLSGITAVALMAAGTAQAGGLDLYGGTGVARTPLAMSLAPMTFQVAAEYVFSEDTFVPMRAAVGLPYGIELGGAYWYTDTTPDDLDIWDLTAKWVLPNFVPNLSLAVGGHYNAFSSDKANLDNDGEDLYAVATYVAPVGEGMALIPSVGFKWVSLTGDNDKDGWKFFGSLLLKGAQFAVGGEYISVDEDIDGKDADGSYWIGGRYFLNPMVTLQAGYINNANIGGGQDFKDGVFHVGAQFAFGGGK
jgi:hypothetical protein